MMNQGCENRGEVSCNVRVGDLIGSATGAYAGTVERITAVPSLRECTMIVIPVLNYGTCTTKSNDYPLSWFVNKHASSPLLYNS